MKPSGVLVMCKLRSAGAESVLDRLHVCRLLSASLVGNDVDDRLGGTVDGLCLT